MTESKLLRRIGQFGPRTTCLALALTFGALGCAKSDTGGTTGTGGTTATGGTTGSGGTGTGGVTSTGGNSNTGGTVGTGGITGTGGNSNTGGKGGTTGTGGTTGSGGKGGAAGRGGTTGTGGTTSTGGATGTGGGAGAGSCPTANETKFSFFVVSQAELIRQGGMTSNGFPTFGGNLGGLAGADKICQTAAEHASACQTSKTWHAFLSTSTADAIDRIGSGPWYDRNGRLWANTKTELTTGDRPANADAAIKNDIPNENGVSNQFPNGGTTGVDNHETITGSGTDGRRYTQSTMAGDNGSATDCGPDIGGSGSGWSADRATCKDWTDNSAEGCPRVGHTWFQSGGFSSGNSWSSVWNEAGCAPGGTLSQTGGVVENGRTIGSAGGYGGFYCFAVVNP